jgi:8-oxo-dGTP pyrophosphatase MutT (NUDIX family)
LSAFTWPPDPSPPGTPSATPSGSSTTPGGISPAPGGEQIPAAVLAPLFTRGDPAQAHLVLTRRRADLRRHAGEISFPGGRMDAEDASLSDTALREAEEEIGLPRSEVVLLGALPAVSTFATNYVIHPFVGTIPAGMTWSPSAREVDAVLELPLAALEAGRTRTRMERRGISFETDAYVVDDHLIWGATARIIEHLLERLQESREGGSLTLR